jgi:hypothetical protein
MTPSTTGDPMNAAGWTISIIAILLVAAVALNVSRKSRRR